MIFTKSVLRPILIVQLQDFVARLKDHLIRRMDGLMDPDAVVPEPRRRALLFQHDRMYPHQTMQVNYTTYDVRRGRDTIHINTDHSNIMVLANEDPSNSSSPAGDPTLYWYAHIIGIYHVNVIDTSVDSMAVASHPKRMEFLHIRWLGRDPDWRSGWAAKRLEQVGFIPETDPGAFDFLDPADVIRACHLIPAFAEGRTRSLLNFSLLARSDATEDDWQRFYVNQ